LSLKQRLDEVRGRIERACARAGRDPAGVTLIAVTKVFPATAIQEAYELGVRDFGENYVQEFEGKHAAVSALAGARFHLIGHLQSNKTRKAAEIFQVIQTVDSSKVARRLNESGKPLEVMIEVKLSEEGSKSGAAPEQVGELAASIRECPHLLLTGLMTMPPWSEEAEPSRPYFRKLRELAAVHGLNSLSMGMSHDFEVAIAEGATHVRVGTALFGPRKRVA
jgi:pyridoxal phosphate enzyme (YggS family)